MGRRVVESELASLEKRFAAHAQRLNKISATAARTSMAGAGRVGGSGTRDPLFGPGQKEFAASLRARERAQLASEKKVARERIAQEKQAGRIAISEAKSVSSAKTSLDRQRARGLYQQHREQEALTRKTQEARASFIKSTVGSGASRVMGAVGAVGRVGVAAAGLGGGALAAAAISQALKTDEISRRLSIAGRGPGEQGVDPRILRKEFTRTGIASGFAPEDIGAATAAYVAKTGDLKTARQNQGLLATVAQGTGSDATETFRTAADLATKLGITKESEVKDSFAILSQQGKKGAFEFKAMASEFPEVLGSAATAGVRGVSGLRDIGAMMQIARDTTGSDSETSTAVNAMFRQISARSKDIQSGKAFGGNKVEVFEGGNAENAMNNFPTVLADIIEASNGNVVQLQDVLDVRGKKAVDPMIAAYQRASRETLEGGGTKKEAKAAGKQKVQEMFAKYRDVDADFGEVERDAADAKKITGVQLEIAMTQLKDAMAGELMPEVVKLAPQLALLVPVVTDLLRVLIGVSKFLSENPFSGLAVALAASISYEVGKAQLAGLLEKAVKRSAGLPTGDGTGTTGTPGKPGPSNLLGAAATGLTLGMSVATMIVSASVVNFEKNEADMDSAGKSLNRLRELQDKSKKTALTPEELKEARDLDMSISKTNEEGKTPGVLEGAISGGITALKYLGPVGWAASAAGLDSDKAAKGINQTLFDQNAEVKQGTLESFSKEASGIRAALEKNTSAILSKAAEKPNTGDKPTGVK